MSTTLEWSCSYKPRESKCLQEILEDIFDTDWRDGEQDSMLCANLVHLESADNKYELIANQQVLYFLAGDDWSSFYGYPDERTILLAKFKALVERLDVQEVLVFPGKADVYSLFCESNAPSIALSDISDYLKGILEGPYSNCKDIQNKFDSDNLSGKNFYYHLTPTSIDKENGCP